MLRMVHPCGYGSTLYKYGVFRLFSATRDSSGDSSVIPDQKYLLLRYAAHDKKNLSNRAQISLYLVTCGGYALKSFQKSFF
jgi:hypothetical protein